jgi:hypothetical protein
MAPEQWTPVVELNLETAGTSAFIDAVTVFRQWAAKQPDPNPLTLQNGWYTVTPQMSEDFLRRNRTNRKVSFQTVRKYYYAMVNGEWRRTGQGLIFDATGKAQDLQHRCWAGYLGNVSFDTFIVTDVPPDADLFAYIDDNKPRSSADALFTSGMNGLSPMIAGAIKLAWRYDHNALAILKQPRVRDMSIREVLEFSRANPTLIASAHNLIGTYPKAVKVIGQKPVAVFFAWRAGEMYGEDALESFLVPLGSGALLAEDSPILALRNRLLAEQDDESAMNQPRRLALLIKAFKLHRAGKAITGRSGLSLRDNERFPRFDGAVGSDGTELPLAAE